MRIATLGLLALLAGAAVPALAQNLVFNPGFETGDFTGWTVSGPPNTFSVEANRTGFPQVSHTGNYAASFGASNPDVDDLRQTLATQSGQMYDLTFFAQTPEFNIPPGHPNQFSVYFGGILVAGPFTVPDGPMYEQYSYIVTATAPTSQLRFLVSNDADFTQLDDISVTLIPTVPPPGAVPEPGVVGLLVGLGTVGTGVFARRRRRSKVSLKKSRFFFRILPKITTLARIVQ